MTVVVVTIGFALAALLIGVGPIALDTLRLTGHGARRDEAAFTGAIFGAMLAIALVGGALSGVAPLALGRRRGAMLALGAALGSGGIAASVGLAWLAGTLVPGQAGGAGTVALALGGALVLLQVLAEEAYFRGWLQPIVARRWGTWVAVPGVAAGFAALHVVGGARDPVAVGNLFLGGVAFGLLAASARGIGPAVGMHFAWNGAEQLLLGLDPNPGVGSFGALRDFDLVGPARWGGTADGINASFAMTIALVAILAPLLLDRGRGAPSARATIAAGAGRPDARAV